MYVESSHLQGHCAKNMLRYPNIAGCLDYVWCGLLGFFVCCAQNLSREQSSQHRGHSLMVAMRHL